MDREKTFLGAHVTPSPHRMHTPATRNVRRYCNHGFEPYVVMPQVPPLAMASTRSSTFRAAITMRSKTAGLHASRSNCHAFHARTGGTITPSEWHCSAFAKVRPSSWSCGSPRRCHNPHIRAHVLPRCRIGRWQKRFDVERFRDANHVRYTAWKRHGKCPAQL